EEYEIDTFKGLTPEARTILIEHKLTTLNDLVRFEDKWMAMEDLEEDQKEMLSKKVATDKKEQIAREKERANMAAGLKNTEEVVETPVKE
ncbi:MAG: hypothetical protein CO040_02780, partial [Candidatus Pacebacteria bacterium CG_4_9_14_0_2_um_filter_36_8]